MKRIDIAIVCAIGVCLISALATASALAANEWLIEGLAIAKTFGMKGPAELTLRDLGLGASVGCSVIFLGSVGPNGEGEIDEMEDLLTNQISNTPLTGISLTCTPLSVCEGREADIWPVNLPWLSKIEKGNEDHIFGVGGKEPGFEVDCTVLGISATDTCQGLEMTTLTNLLLLPAEPNDVNAAYNPAVTQECSLGGPGTGVIEGTHLITVLSEKELAVS